MEEAMAKDHSGGMDFELTSGGSRPKGQGGPRPERPDPETPFRMLVLGDFSGRENRGISQTGSALGSRRPIAIDTDNFDAAMSKLGVQLQLRIGDAQDTKMPLAFKSLDDFHPDRLAERSPIFQMLKRMKQMLASPSTFEAAAAQVRALLGQSSAPAAPTSAAPAGSGGSQDELFERLLGAPASNISQPGAKKVDVSSIMEDAVRGHVVPDAPPEQAELRRILDEAMAIQMRAILNQKDFQALEAAWRSLHFLVSRLELGEELQLFLLDISRPEVLADLRDPGSGLNKLIIEQTIHTPGAEPWALIIGNYTFNDSQEDVELLARLATLASEADAAFLGAASPQVFGCSSLGESPDAAEWQDTTSDTWQKLRKLPQCEHVALAFPRLMLRLPYGSDTEPTDLPGFEEFTPNFAHEQYVWGNPAFGCAYALADGFRENGWDMEPGGFLELSGLPIHNYQKEGEKQVKPSAEAFLTDRAASKIQDRGVIPLMSIRGRDAARFAGFHSIAAPAKPLAGPWSS
jgi:type VI secretion system ImpB/VipA family protein